MPKTSANGIAQHYLTIGQGPDVVMLHGFLGNLAVWHLNMVPALRNTFRVTTVDLRGHGYSEVTPTGYTTENLAQDLKAFLDAIGIRRPHLVGHSFGADVCLHFALLNPQRVDRVVAIEPGLAALVHQRKDQDWEGWTYWVSKLEEVGLTVPADKRVDLDYLLTLSLETPKFYGPARGLPRNREPLINLLRNTTLMKDYEEPGSLTLDAVGKIDVPVFLVYGERSHFLKSYDFLRKTLRNCSTALLPGGEHFGPLEQPERLVTLMRDYLGPRLAPADPPRPTGPTRDLSSGRARDLSGPAGDSRPAASGSHLAG
jgi:pimeloyl-ACP methyl ester carboxylesterase